MSQRPALFTDEDFLDRLVKLLQWDKPTLERCVDLMKPDDFNPVSGMRWGRPRWTVAEQILSHYKTHRTAPGKLLNGVLLDYAHRLKLSHSQVAEIEQYLKHLNKVPKVPAAAVLDKILPYKEERRRASVIEELIDHQNDGTLTREIWQQLTDKAFARASTLEPTSASTLYDTAFPAPAFAVNNKLATGLAMLAAKPKIGKTWMAIQLATAIACGDELFLKGKVKTPGMVLYYALEDTPRRLSERLHMLCPEAGGSDFERMHVLHEWHGVGTVEALVQKHKYKLIVIDPYLATTPERKTQDLVRADYAELQPLRKLAEKHKTTVLVVHHLRKATGEARDLVIGTTGLTAAVDTLWILQNTPDGDKAKRLTITGRDVPERTLNVELSFSAGTQFGWRVIADGPEAEAGGPLQRQILRLLADNGAMFSKEIARTLNRESNNVYVRLHKMRNAGIVEKQENGKYVHPEKPGK